MKFRAPITRYHVALRKKRKIAGVNIEGNIICQWLDQERKGAIRHDLIIYSLAEESLPGNVDSCWYDDLSDETGSRQNWHGRIYVHHDLFLLFIDILRNEGPLNMHFNTKNPARCGITTAKPEKVGEGEL